MKQKRMTIIRLSKTERCQSWPLSPKVKRRNSNPSTRVQIE